MGVCIGIMGINASCQDDAWAWIHNREFTQEQRSAHKQKNEIICTSKEVAPFTQLIFSWNAFRPLQGLFTFYVKVRNAQTKGWSGWHKMIDWGNGVQRSYVSKSDGVAQYFHVRLEVASGTKADAFSIKVEGHDNADLSLISSCAVCCADFSLFAHEKQDVLAPLLSSVKISGVPRLSQFEVDHPRNDGLCSPTSCTMLVRYLTKKPLDPLAFADGALDNGLDQFGSWPFNMAHAFMACQGTARFIVARLNSFRGIHQRLEKGIPVVVSVRGTISGAPKSYPSGHLLVVVGYDKDTKQVICHDPAAPCADEVEKQYALSDFLAAWERSKRLSYLAEPIKVEYHI